jgi:O-antigen biosynthesis protein WbqV
VERNPVEGVLTNVFGTLNVARAGIAAGIDTMVMISTDKAVHPSNVMGATKRLAEHLWAQHAAQSTVSRLLMVRFGNVLGSAGSVIPLFQEQLRMGGPLTVTHPDMERYFMTIREAAGLVIQAATLPEARSGLFVLDMGEPVKITELAEQMIRLAGLRPYEDIPITITGLRPGEKLSEVLTYENETLHPTEHPKISQAITRNPDTPASMALEPLWQACSRRDPQALRECLHRLVPDYHNDKLSMTAPTASHHTKETA